MQDLNLNNNDTIIWFLKKFILNQIENERRLTQNKINLFLICSMEQIFKIFTSNNDYITSEDIKHIFNMLEIKEIEKIIEIYDKDKDSFLNYDEFYNFIFPKYIDININETREKNQKNLDCQEIDDETISLLYNIFQIEIINLIDSSELMKKIINNINNSPNINIYLYLFELIKGTDKNYDYLNEFIDNDDLIKFLSRNSSGIEIYEQDVTNFIYRYDYSNNSKLNIEEFTNMINYFLSYENNNTLNEENKLKTRNKLHVNYSTKEKINNHKNRIKNDNNSNSMKYEISLLEKTNNDENIIINSNQNTNNINSAINHKEKELRNLKIKLLTEYFQNIIKELIELEQKKNELSEAINAKELFSFFDIRKEENINANDFISVFNDFFKIKFNEEDFSYLIYYKLFSINFNDIYKISTNK